MRRDAVRRKPDFQHVWRSPLPVLIHPRPGTPFAGITRRRHGSSSTAPPHPACRACRTASRCPACRCPRSAAGWATAPPAAGAAAASGPAPPTGTGSPCITSYACDHNGRLSKRVCEHARGGYDHSSCICRSCNCQSKHDPHLPTQPAQTDMTRRMVQDGMGDRHLAGHLAAA